MIKQAQDGKFYLKHQNGVVASGFEYLTYEAMVRLDENGVACCDNENIARAVMMRDIFDPYDPFEETEKGLEGPMEPRQMEAVEEIPRRKRRKRK